MRSGEIAMIDFGNPIGSIPALVRPAVIVTVQPTLDQFDQTFQVVPIASTVRHWPSDVPTEHGHAQCHLLTVVDRSQVVQQTTENVGAVVLAQMREIVSVLLGI
jgi:mRNA-degrading endonuclease toxin of MazEF toxin-antitoxin module